MKKIISNLILSIIILIILLLVMLSTLGIKTNKFNDLISKKVSETRNINLKLNSVKFKINPKEFNLFLETENPNILFKEVLIPAKNIKVYIDFISLLKSDPKIKKASVALEELDIAQLNKLSIILKPSNLKNLINRIKKGKIISEIDFFLTDQGNIENFIAKGEVKNLQAKLLNNLNFTKINLEFFADKKDILIKNIFGNLEDIKISNGDLKINLDNGIKLNSSFNSKLNYKENLFEKYAQYFKKYRFVENIQSIKLNFNNNFSINLDNTYKVIDYNIKLNGKIEKANFQISPEIKTKFISNQLKEVYFSDLEISTEFKPKKIDIKSMGKYSFNNIDFLKIDFHNNFNDKFMNLKLNFDFKNGLDFKTINYKKTKDSIANLYLNLKKEKNILDIKNLDFQEGKNFIKIDNLILKNNKLISFNQIQVKTKNNDFSIKNDKKIVIKGEKFDATNLIKSFNNQDNENKLTNINNEIEIDFKNIKVPMSEKLQNFKLIGEIKKGQFIKISSKGDFGANNFLDISMKKDENTEKKYLEIYSDLPRPLLTEYSFFQGLSGGKLIFTSIIDKTSSNSKLKIENFKVINAPAVIKLLSLADLGGLADLTEGDGLTFDLLEIDMEKNRDLLKINEILALGPSVSVLMEGYQDNNGITSLRGTLVPAKMLNKMISKIPVIGNIVIPKEVGEGIFGISFKMKGSKDNIKTTINPIRTLTPRFIQKIIDKKKTTK